MWGRLFHFTVDAALVSAVLAGIKRNTGLQIATHNMENEEMKKYLEKYLNVGEWVLDSSAVFMSNSPYFERKN
ncbi:hypothetical protein BDB01DRAFT_847098 [Pilobolus umbonatus]|nr:hypothetical protein BDB01DRAFT_847098 [Pilobolus umbonatus]